MTLKIITDSYNNRTEENNSALTLCIQILSTLSLFTNSIQETFIQDDIWISNVLIAFMNDVHRQLVIDLWMRSVCKCITASKYVYCKNASAWKKVYCENGKLWTCVIATERVNINEMAKAYENL